MSGADGKRKWWGAVLVGAAVAVTAGPWASGEFIAMDEFTVLDGQQPGGSQGEELITGFVVPKEDSKTLDKLADFDRYSEKKSWELAFRTMNDLSKTDGVGMVPTDDKFPTGERFYVPLRRKLTQSLVTLPAEGRAAYRLFYDAEAKQLWERLKDPKGLSALEETRGLQKIVNQFFLTTVGDIAADRLGDLSFEKGDFGAAEAAWAAVARDYPDGRVSVAKLQVKRCVALARMGRWEDLAAVAEIVREQYAEQKITIGGQEVAAGEFVKELLAQQGEAAKPATVMRTTPEEPEIGEIKLASEGPAWQIRVAPPGTLEKMDAQLRQSGWGYYGLQYSGTVPGAVADGKRVYVNWMGVVYAADLETGKILWRTGKFNEVPGKAMNFVQYGVDINRFSISLHDGKLYAMVVDSPRGENQAQMYCYDAEGSKDKDGKVIGAKVIWKGDRFGTPSLSMPYIVGNTGYCVGAAGADALFLIVFNVETGAQEWRLTLGKVQGGQNYRGNVQVPEPRMVATTGMLYVATNNGALLAVNTAQRRVEWAFRHETKPVTPGFRGYDLIGTDAPGTLMMEGNLLYLKDAGGARLYAIDPLGPTVKWKRPMDAAATLLKIDGNTAYAFDKQLLTFNLKTRDPMWSSQIFPMENGTVRPLLGKEHIYVSTSRGIYDMKLRPGAEPEIFRGSDKEGSGGRLLVSGGKLINVNDSVVTAYKLGSGGVKAANDAGEKASP